jgi:hypothetical protein
MIIDNIDHLVCQRVIDRYFRDKNRAAETGAVPRSGMTPDRFLMCACAKFSCNAGREYSPANRRLLRRGGGESEDCCRKASKIKTLWGKSLSEIYRGGFYHKTVARNAANRILHAWPPADKIVTDL